MHKTKQEQNYFELVHNHKNHLWLLLPEEGRGKKPIQAPLQKKPNPSISITVTFLF